MKDFLITLAFSASIFLLIYVVGAGFASFVAWDLSLFDVATWSASGRAVLGIVGILLGGVALMFCFDEMTWKRKCYQAEEHVKATEEFRLAEAEALQRRITYESSNRCRYTSVRVW